MHGWKCVTPDIRVNPYQAVVVVVIVFALP
jgi:hypothetical protein